MRRSRSRSTHSALTGKPAGSPSTRATRAFPCDSPAVEKRRCMSLFFVVRAPMLTVPRCGPERERARPAPGSFPSGPQTGRAGRLLLVGGAVVGDPGRDQDNEVAPVFLIVAETEQLADDRQVAQQRDAGLGLGDL